jgi:hypothetical protein
MLQFGCTNGPHGIVQQVVAYIVDYRGLATSAVFADQKISQLNMMLKDTRCTEWIVGFCVKMVTSV